VYAPRGLSDVSNLVVRPNPVLAARSVVRPRQHGEKEQWPELTVLGRLAPSVTATWSGG